MYRTPSNAPFWQLLSEWDLVVEVRSLRLDLSGDTPWTAAFKCALDDWSFVLGDAGVLSLKRARRDERGGDVKGAGFDFEPIGSYRFFAPGELVLPPELPPLECPLLPAPHGYAAFKLDWAASEGQVEELVRGLIKEGMGRILATERDWKHARGDGPAALPSPAELIDVSCTAKKKFPLLLGKYSIEDGDVLLSREAPEYVSYVIDEVKAALAREGYQGELGITSTCHNPFRYWQEGERFDIFGPNGSRPSQRKLEWLLAGHDFEIWVLDFGSVRRLTDSVEISVMWS
jgi:hypothetical protein